MSGAGQAVFMNQRSFTTPPVNTVLPVITGTATEGQTLSVNDGTWTGTTPITFTRQWQRNTSNISGQTGTTYVLAPADIGNTVRCVVTATNVVSSASVNTANTATVVGAAPSNSVAPTISGTAVLGNSLSVSSNGTWVGTATITFSYQWQRNTSNISGATSSTYEIVSADVGNTVRCVVTGTNAYGSASANSSSTATITLPAIGTALGGGFFAGQISATANSVPTANLIVGPASTAEAIHQWKNASTATPGADSLINGPQNTADMVADGSSTVYPAAHFCNDLVIGGFSDWYMPAQNEIEVCYYRLKPGTTSNNTSVGINANAVPARASNYTAGDPAQTSAVDFQTGGSEAFLAQNYWSSTETGASTAHRKYFNAGQEYNSNKQNSQNVRAIRRLAI